MNTLVEVSSTEAVQLPAVPVTAPRVTPALTIVCQCDVVLVDGVPLLQPDLFGLCSCRWKACRKGVAGTKRRGALNGKTAEQDENAPSTRPWKEQEQQGHPVQAMLAVTHLSGLPRAS